MAREVHFEVFRRQGAKGGWTLLEAASDREAAIQLAQKLMSEGSATGVKVVKETYNSDTGDFLTLKIFEDGHNQVKVPALAEDMPHALPCFRAEDLYSYHGRATIARLLPDFLARNKITVTELMHRADALEKFEATGTLYQHAVQKIAVAQAASTSTPVQQIIKSLNELATKAIQRVYRDEKRQFFPKLEARGFTDLANKAAAGGEGGTYLFNGAIAQYLRDAKGWDEKVHRLLVLLEQAPESGPGRTLLLSSVDAIIAEILNGSAALHELLGATNNLGEALLNLVQLFLGKEPDDPSGNCAGLIALTHHFAADDLPNARTAIALRIIAEIKSVKRLNSESVVEELKALRQIANRVVVCVGKYMSHDDLVAAFTRRSKRFVTHESLSDMLAEAQAPDEKIEKLLFVEENVIGTDNKRQLAAFLLPIVTAAPFENYFLDPKMAVLARLQRLAAIQTRIRRSSMQDNQRQEIADAIDKVALEAENRAKLFATLEAKPLGDGEKAATILRLCTGGALTEGKLYNKARGLVLNHLSRPGFLTGYTAHLGKTTGAPTTPDKAMSELVELLEKVGITEETGLKSIAA